MGFFYMLLVSLVLVRVPLGYTNVSAMCKKKIFPPVLKRVRLLAGFYGSFTKTYRKSWELFGGGTTQTTLK